MKKEGIEYKGAKMEDEKTFPKNLFVYNAWPVIGDILKRRFSEMWGDATPVDISNNTSTDSGK